MMLPELAVDTAAVVVTGLFRPEVMTPKWLRDQDLISRDDFDECVIEQVAAFATVLNLPHLALTVTTDRIQVLSREDGIAEQARDLIMGILRSVPDDTPVASLGINRMVHFICDSDTAYHAIGDRLAPKNHWNKLLGPSGTNDLQIRGARKDGWRGSVVVQVQPSTGIPLGVFVALNDHFALVPDTSSLDARSPRFSAHLQPVAGEAERLPEKRLAALDVLVTCWADSRSKSDEVISMVASLGHGSGG